jgi:membrane protease YdiL (CAAX protease family)
MERDAAAKDSGSEAAAAMSGQRAGIEVAVTYLLILAVIWTPRPLQRFLWIVAAAGVVVFLWGSFEGWKAMGFTIAKLGRSLWIVGAALAVTGIAIAVAARAHSLLLPAGVAGFLNGYISYAIWTGVQQFLLQGFFLLRLLRVAPNGWIASLAAAVLFAAAHLPNPVLAPLTLLWGFAACLLFLRYRNIYPLMMAHAILGITVAITVPGPVDHNMRVGLGYLTYNRHARPHERRLWRFGRPEFRRIENRVLSGL